MFVYCSEYCWTCDINDDQTSMTHSRHVKLKFLANNSFLLHKAEWRNSVYWGTTIITCTCISNKQVVCTSYSRSLLGYFLILFVTYYSWNYAGIIDACETHWWYVLVWYNAKVLVLAHVTVRLSVLDTAKLQ